MKDNFSIIKVFNDPNLNFQGNTAAVLFHEKPISKTLMQSIAADLNQPATSFILPTQNKNEFTVAWFAPDAEIGLCGHGSMAQTAWLGENLGLSHIRLKADKAALSASFIHNGEAEIALDALLTKQKLKVSQDLENALGVNVLEYYSTDNKYLVLLENEEAVKNMQVDFSALRKLQAFGYTITARGNTVDFVSRTLVPKVQQLEDHATGSSHAVLTPFWSDRLNKKEMIAHQLSKRGGKFICTMDENTVKLKGNYQILAQGNFKI